MRHFNIKKNLATVIYTLIHNIRIELEIMTLFSKGHRMKTTQNEAIEVITAPILKEWINPNEVHQEFGFSVSTLAKWRMSNKHLKYSKIGKYIKYKRAEIISFLETHTIETVA